MPRKPVPLDLAELEKLAAMHCTHAEVGAWFGLARQVIDRKLKQKVYAEVWERGWAKGAISLRRHQVHCAEAENPTMLIWLGKQWLGQADKQEITHLTLDAMEAEVARLERELATND